MPEKPVFEAVDFNGGNGESDMATTNKISSTDFALPPEEVFSPGSEEPKTLQAI